MGKRGPKPTPTPLLRLRGSWRGETRDGEPQVVASLPDCPLWVNETAREHWTAIGSTLVGLGIMAPVYSIVLGCLVDALADYIAETDPDAKVKRREHLLKFVREFGMTPSAITNVKKTTEDKPQGLEAFKIGG